MAAIALDRSSRRQPFAEHHLLFTRIGVLAVALLMALPLAAPALAQPAPPPPQVARPGEQWAVALDRSPLRLTPDADGEQVGSTHPLSPLRVLGYQDDWANVLDPRTNGTAFIRGDMLGPSDPPSSYVTRPRPAVADDLEQSRGIVTGETSLAIFPSTAEDAAELPIEPGTWLTLDAQVQGEDGEPWYRTPDGDYVPAANVFLADAPDRYSGRWLDVDLSTPTRVTAYEGEEPARSFLAIHGVGQFPTPTGTFTIMRRVANETMDSQTLGIPRNGPGGYYLTGVLFTQYFLPTGESLHYNYWSSNWGYAGSHGCLGLTYADAAYLWDWAGIGTPLSVHY